MQIIRQPRVTLLARQQFLYPDHINWQSDSEVPAEVLENRDQLREWARAAVEVSRRASRRTKKKPTPPAQS